MSKTEVVVPPPPRKYKAWNDRKDFYFDRKAAYNAARFFETELVHVKDSYGAKAGASLRLERWQYRFVRRLYGWKRRDNNTRRYRTAFVFVPRKNGKSFLGAGIALYGLVADGEMGAECVSAAADREQARVIFDVAKQIVQCNNKLAKKITSYVRTLVVHKTASKYSVLSADVENKHGSNPSTIIFDELHTQPNGNLVEVLKTGTGARNQPLTVFFTTAGHDKTSVCYEYYKKAKDVQAEPWRDPTFLPLIFECSPDDDWKDSEVWKKANPNYGVSVNPINFEQSFNDALENTRLENSFKRLHLNMWTEQMERWINMDEWDACATPTFTRESLKGLVCVGGMDLSTKKDLTAFVLVFRDREGVHYILPYFWLPKVNLKKKAEKDSVPYVEWAQDNYLELTPGDIIDYEYIRKKVNELDKEFKIKEIGFDSHRAEQIAVQLDGDGLEMVEVSQSFGKLSEPSKELEALLQARQIRHNGHPLLRWMAQNVSIETNATGDIRPSKKEAKTRIDGITALVNALSRIILHKARKKSRYEDGELLVL